MKRRPPKVQRSLRLSEAAWQAIEAEAEAAGLSLAEVVERWALRERTDLEDRLVALEAWRAAIEGDAPADGRASAGAGGG